MKNRDIEKQLKKDLSVASRSDFSSLMDKCRGEQDTIVVRERAIAGVGGEGEAKRSPVLKYTIWILMLLLLVSTLLLIVPSTLDNGPSTSGYFVIDINPSIKISYDEDGKVTEVSALNEDAEVLLVGLEFSNKTPEEAVSLLFEKCVALGYFSSERDDNAVLASATTNAGEKDEKMTAQIKELFSKEFSSKKMRGVVITAVDDASLNEKANEHGIDSQKYALILSYKELGGELDESEYGDISISELYKKISDKEKALKNERLDSVRQEQEKAQNDLFKALSDSVDKLISRLEACIGELENEGSDDEIIDTPPSNNERPSHSQGGAGAPPAQENRPSQTDKPSKDRYEGFAGDLSEYIERLDKAKESNDCTRAVEEILAILSEMRADEENVSLVEVIDEAEQEIQALYADFTKASSELEQLKASVEQTHNARLDAFKDTTAEEHENVDEWQKSKEEEIASSWYELKKQWNDARKNDLKK